MAFPNPGGSNQRVDQAFELLQQKRITEATALLEVEVMENPQNGTAFQYLGVARSQAGDVAGGILALREASRLLPSSASVLHNLGVALAQARQIDEARVTLETALALDPANVAARMALQRLGTASSAPASPPASATPVMPTLSSPSSRSGAAPSSPARVPHIAPSPEPDTPGPRVYNLIPEAPIPTAVPAPSGERSPAPAPISATRPTSRPAIAPLIERDDPKRHHLTAVGSEPGQSAAGRRFVAEEKKGAGFGAVMQAAMPWGARFLPLFLILAVVALGMVFSALMPDQAFVTPDTAGSALLWSLILLSLCTAVAGWENTAAGYLLLLGAFVLQSVLPQVLPYVAHRPAQVSTDAKEAAATAQTLKTILQSCSQAAALPGIIGIVLIIKDIVFRLIAGLALKRPEVETPSIFYAASATDAEEGDMLRRYHKYRLLVIPTLVAATVLYLALLQPLRGVLEQGLGSINTAVAQVFQDNNNPPRIMGGISTPPSPAVKPPFDKGGNSGGVNPLEQASNDLKQPYFINALLIALGVMFVSQVMILLEWAIYKLEW